MIHYRDMKEEDKGAIMRLLLIMHQESDFYRQYDPDYGFFEGIFNLIVGEQFGMVACDDDEIVGVMMGHMANMPMVIAPSANEIILYVHPHHRGGLIGRRLINLFEKWGVANGAVLVAAGDSANISSQVVSGLYLTSGFEPAGSVFHKYLN